MTDIRVVVKLKVQSSRMHLVPLQTPTVELFVKTIFASFIIDVSQGPKYAPNHANKYTAM